MRYGLGISDHDTEGRVVTAEFESFYLLCVYVPNSGDGLKRLVLDPFYFRNITAIVFVWSRVCLYSF